MVYRYTANTLVGNISVVGPRPHMMMSHTPQYAQLDDKFIVHFLKPGVTGWAQISGFKDETKPRRDVAMR
jgi:lipopolysaccharide/colanic/teichoic acid biosynthesis glycosyltransferase